MEYTDQYVYVNVTDTLSATIDESLKVVLNYSTDRTPYALVEVIAFSVKAEDADKPYYTLKTLEIAQNYLGYDNQGTALAVATYDSEIAGSKRVYTMAGFGTKMMFSNPRSLTFYIVDENNVKVDIGTEVENFVLLLKVSYPKVGEIPPAYRSQIPLSSGF